MLEAININSRINYAIMRRKRSKKTKKKNQQIKIMTKWIMKMNRIQDLSFMIAIMKEEKIQSHLFHVNKINKR